MSLIVSNGLVSAGDQPQLNPEIAVWAEQLSAYRQRWFDCADKVPLGWYAALCGMPASALLASQGAATPKDTDQFWVMSPYHAQLARDSVRVFPEGLLAWTADDADDLCATLNPLLADEGMAIQRVGAALLLTCKQALKVSPQGFGEISGHLLPNKHHQGEDGGRLNRLLSEIQMTLFQHPSDDRKRRGELDVNGVWLWSCSQHESDCAATAKHIAVATRNPVLQSIADGKDARLMITEAERMHELIQQKVPLPKRIVLAGEGYAVLLTTSWLPKFGKSGWKPKSRQPELTLFSTLQKEFVSQAV